MKVLQQLQRDALQVLLCGVQVARRVTLVDAARARALRLGAAGDLPVAAQQGKAE